MGPVSPIALLAQLLLTLEVFVLAVAAKVVLRNWPRPIKSSYGQTSGTNHTTVIAKWLYIQAMAI